MRSPENVLESLKSKACNKSYKYERLYRNPVSYTHLITAVNDFGWFSCYPGHNGRIYLCHHGLFGPEAASDSGLDKADVR